MSIPGNNLYRMARQVIGGQKYDLFAQNGTTEDDRGFDITLFAAAVPLVDSIQAVPRKIYQQLGLDFDKYYIMIYTDNPLVVVDRDKAGGQIVFNTQRFQLLDNNDWKPQDSWEGVMAVRINPETSVT